VLDVVSKGTWAVNLQNRPVLNRVCRLTRAQLGNGRKMAECASITVYENVTE